jgi:hypothetical protein
MINPKVGEDGRYEVLRTLKPGEERRLPEHVRFLVLRRDSVQCVFCGNKGRLEIDHIIPWSAGGSDDMDNLRTLCHSCNQTRSNFASEGDTEPRRFPTGHECVYCTPAILGDPEVRNVYCIHCNKLAPGIPVNDQEPLARDVYDETWPDELIDQKLEELEELAAKQRAAAIATIRQALLEGEAS